MMQLCALLGKLPEELLDGLGQDKLDLWMIINAKRREWIHKNINAAGKRSLDAKELAYQYFLTEIAMQQALWTTM